MINTMTLDQKELVARALANLDELKPIMENMKKGDILQVMADSKSFINSLDISIKCLEHLYVLDKDAA